jgi:hypothetical protein
MIAGATFTERPYFFVTGFPKSGNKWLQQQLIDFETVGGFHTDPNRGIPLLASAILDHTTLKHLLGDAGVALERFVCELFDPRPCSSRNQWPAQALPALQSALHDLAVQASRLVGAPVPPAAFAHIFDSNTAAATRIDTSRWQAIAVPGMHTPLAEVRRLLPSFRIVHLVRDPRDVVVSYFYHYLGTLTMPLAQKLVIADDATGEIALNPKWKRPFARRVMRSLREYYDQRLPEADADGDGVLRVRYEDLLEDGAVHLRRILAFVNCHEEADTIRSVVERHRFSNQADSHRDSVMRKGQAGDWRNYFDRELVRALGDDFVRLVIDLGYEPDDAWARQAPRRAPAVFDFSRFRIERSTTRQFAYLWDRSPDLRGRYPNPWQTGGNDSFYHWLCRCDDPQVQRWLELARRLQEFWQPGAIDVSGTR